MFSRRYQRLLGPRSGIAGRGRVAGPYQTGRRRRLDIEILEDRTLLSTLSFTGSQLLWNGFGIGTANSVSISVVGSNYVLHDDAEAIQFGPGVPSSWSADNHNTATGPISSVTSLTIDGGSDTRASDTFALNSAISTAGSVTVTGFDKISVNGSITTTAGSGGAVTLTANAMSASMLTILAGATITSDGTVALTARGATAASGNITTNNRAITVNAGTTLALNANLNAGTGSVALSAGGDATFGHSVVISGSSFSGNFGGNFLGTLTLLNFGTVMLSVTGDFGGQLAAGDPGIIQTITIGKSLTGSISAKTLNQLTVGGSIAATATVMVHGSGEIGSMTVEGDMAGTVMGETITTITTASLDGSVTSTGSGTIGTLTVLNTIGSMGKVSAENITMLAVGHTMAGSITVLANPNEAGTGLLQTLVVGSGSAGDALTGSVMVKAVNALMVHGNVAATGNVTAHGSGEIGSMTVDGDMAGTVMGETITTITTASLDGSVTSTGSGTIGTLTVLNSIGGTGKVSAENVTTLLVGHTMAGTITVLVNPSESGTGVLQILKVGSGAAGDGLTGTVSAASTLGTVVVNGATPGTIFAGKINTVSATAASGSSLAGTGLGFRVLQITQAEVTRQLQVSSATPVFSYFYDSTSPGDPQLSVRVANPAKTQFDLSLITDSSTNGLNLARIDALSTLGSPTASGLRNLAIMGSLLPTVTPAALSFFTLPAGTPGGVQLPADGLASVAVQNNVVAGTIHAASIQELAFGSYTVGGVTMPGETANSSTAAGLLPPGTAIVPAAANTFSVPFSEVTKVNLFLDTGPGRNFDSKNVLFAKASQFAGGESVIAQVTIGLSGHTAVIQAIDLNGNGGSIQTSQEITTRVTSTGPLTGLVLGAPDGLIATVTAPSIPGSIDITNGPIAGTIQTTVGDLGSPLTNGAGQIIGTTTVHANGGISGQILSRGNLISLIESQKDIAGVIAAQEDIGVALVNAAGQLTARFGGVVSSSGGLDGQVVALGNVFGDISIHGGLTGRIAVKGRPVPGLAITRFGILGNVSVSGSIDANAAIVSGGLIGDAAGGTVLTSGSINGILAAKAGINFGSTGNTNSAFIFNPATGANATAIDLIFTHNGLPLDLGSLSLILQKLGLGGLKVVLVNGVPTLVESVP